jgi:hypothetical protein
MCVAARQGRAPDRRSQARADRAEAAVAAERTRADALRDRDKVEDLERQLAAAEAEGNELTVETADGAAQAGVC